MRMTNRQFTVCLQCQAIVCYKADCEHPHCEVKCTLLLNHAIMIEEHICSDCITKLMLGKKGNGHA